MECFKITVYPGANPYIGTREDVAVQICDLLLELDVNDPLEITKIEMNEEEFNDLPDWDGP